MTNEYMIHHKFPVLDDMKMPKIITKDTANLWTFSEIREVFMSSHIPTTGLH